MSIPFNPPDWLVQAYMARKDADAQAPVTALTSALGSYAQLKQVQASRALAQQAAMRDNLNTYVKAYDSGGPDLAGSVGRQLGMQNAPALPGAPTVAPAPVGKSPDDSTPQPGIPTNPSQAAIPSPISPVVQASIQAGHGNPLGIQMPPGGLMGDISQYLNQGKYGDRQIDNRTKVAQAAFKDQEAQSKADEMGPKSFDYARGLAKNAGKPDAADSFINLAQQEGRNTLTKREITDLMSSIQAGSNANRGNYFAGMIDLKGQQVRNQLIDDARKTLSPMFQGGAGKEQMDRLQNIGRAEPLIQQMLSQPGGGDPRQMRELATTMDRVIKGSGSSAQSQIEELVPQTARGRFANWKEWFSNDPTGTDQQAFIRRYADTIAREKGAVQGQIKNMAETNAPTLRVLKEHYPEDYQALVDSVLNNPNMVGSNTPAATGGADDKPAQEDGFAYTPGPGGKANKANWSKVR